MWRLSIHVECANATGRVYARDGGGAIGPHAAHSKRWHHRVMWRRRMCKATCAFQETLDYAILFFTGFFYNQHLIWPTMLIEYQEWQFLLRHTSAIHAQSYHQVVLTFSLMDGNVTDKGSLKIIVNRL